MAWLIGVAAAHDAMMQSDNDEDLKATRDAITVAGRKLAIATDQTPEALLAAKNNADMAAFSMTGLYDTGLDGGNPKNSEGGVEGSYWCEDILFEAVCAGNATSSDVTGINVDPIPLVIVSGQAQPTVNNTGAIVGWIFQDQGPGGGLVALTIANGQIELNPL